MVFFKFLNFFATFLEFSITRRVGTKFNDNFCFTSFSAISNLFWLQMKPQWYFLIFWNFLFGIFDYVSGRNWTETEWSFLFSLFLGLFQHIFAWKVDITVFFNFLNFFVIFLEFSITRQVGTERTDNFYFLSFSSFSNLFLL